VAPIAPGATTTTFFFLPPVYVQLGRAALNPKILRPWLPHGLVSSRVPTTALALAGDGSAKQSIVDFRDSNCARSGLPGRSRTRGIVRPNDGTLWCETDCRSSSTFILRRPSSRWAERSPELRERVTLEAA